MTFHRVLFAAFGTLCLTGAAHAELLSFDTLPPGHYWERHQPAMGDGYAYPGDMPTGPYYWVHDGKVVGIEFVMKQEDFAAGQSWPDLDLHPGLGPVDHVKISYEQTGWGDRFLMKPVYVLDIFFVGEDVLAGIE